MYRWENGPVIDDLPVKNDVIVHHYVKLLQAT